VQYGVAAYPPELLEKVTRQNDAWATED
jgi:hypothetical protein